MTQILAGEVDFLQKKYQCIFLKIKSSARNSSVCMSHKGTIEDCRFKNNRMYLMPSAVCEKNKDLQNLLVSAKNVEIFANFHGK